MCAAQSRRRYSLRLFLCLKFFALNHKIKILKFLDIPYNEPLNLSYRLFCQNDKALVILTCFFCHTERSEVSIKIQSAKLHFKSVDFSLTLKMTMDIFATLWRVWLAYATFAVAGQMKREFYALFSYLFCEVLLHKKIKTTLKRVSAVRSHSRAIKSNPYKMVAKKPLNRLSSR